jgi:hypothetical protein
MQRETASGGRRAAVVAVVAGMALGAIVLGGGVAFKYLKSAIPATQTINASDPAGVPSSAAPTGSTTGAHEADAGTHEEPAPPSTATATAIAPPPATTTAAAAATPTGRRPPIAQPQPQTPKTAAVKLPPAPDCNPPFTFVDGIKKYKPECLGK